MKEVVQRHTPFFYVILPFLWQLLFFYIPILLMVWLSITAIDVPFFNATYFLIVVRSCILAIVTGILCFLIGYPLAYFLAFKAGRFRLFFLFLVILPFWTNFLLHVYAWMFVLDQEGIVNKALLWLGFPTLSMLNSLFAILLLMVYCYLPFMVLPIYSALDRFDKTLLEASEDLGATPFETWYHIVLPLSMTGVISGFFLVFVAAFGEFAIPGLMGGEKFIFVGSVITQYALGAETLEYAAAFTLFSFVCLLILIGIGYGLKNLFQTYWGHSDT